jgi:hypothetical protein
MKSTELAKEITATMTLRLPGTTGKIANKMRYIDATAPKLIRGKVVRPIIQGQFEKVRATGIACISNHLPAFGGILYGAAALRHDVTVLGNNVVDTYQDSRIDINDINYLQTRQRLIWKEYSLVYELLTELFSESNLPHLILTDTPLLIARGEQGSNLEEDDIKQEWNILMTVMTKFWEENIKRIYPENPNGPMLVSVSRRHFGAVLNAIRLSTSDASPETIDLETLALINQEWDRLREAGIMRVMNGMLSPGKRTAAYYYDALGPEVLRAQPKIISKYGLIGLHARVGIKTPVWQLETLGNRESGRWTTEEIDRMVSMIAYLTLYDNPKTLPLPLWYAKKLVRMPRSILVNYMRETLRLLRDRTVDSAWLDGIDSFDDESNLEGEVL